MSATPPPSPAPGRWAQAPTRHDLPTADDAVAAPNRLRAAVAAVALPAVVIALLVGWRASRHGWSAALVGLTVVAIAVLVLAAIRPGPFRRATDAFGHAVGAAFAAVALTIVWLLAVELPGLGQRLLRIDPFEGPGRRTGSRWIDRGRRDRQPEHRWAPEPALIPLARPVRRRRRIGAAVVVTVLAVLAAGITYVGAHTSVGPFGVLSPAVAARSVAPPFPDKTPAAYADADWYPQHQADIRWLWTVATAWDPFSMLRIKDVRTRTVNVVDGVRKTWHPPACDCPRLKVWFYGGSTAFGLGQRDEHTIASELARVAWADGVALDIDNRGVPGWLHWQDANRYAWDTATYGSPDAALFYDGFNEIYGTEGLDEVGDGYAPVDPYAAVYWRTVTGKAKAPTPPDGAGMLETPTLDRNAANDQAKLIMDRYDRSRKMSRDTAAAHDLRPDWFWEPSRWSRPRIEGEPDSGGFAGWHKLDGQLRGRLSPEVHDVAGALDGSTKPYFYDDAHHNEEAAHLIAVAMWKDLKAKYTALAAKK